MNRLGRSRDGGAPKERDHETSLRHRINGGLYHRRCFRLCTSASPSSRPAESDSCSASGAIATAHHQWTSLAEPAAWGSNASVVEYVQRSCVAVPAAGERWWSERRKPRHL